MIFYYKHIFDFINQVETPKSGLLKKVNSQLNGVFATLSIDTDRFILKFTTQVGPNRIEAGKIFKKVGFDAPQPLVFHDFFIKNTSFNTDWSKPNHVADLSRLWSKGLGTQNLYFYRLVIPVEKKIDLLFKIQNVRFETDYNASRNGTLVTINNVVYTIHYTEEKSTSRRFLIINSSIKQNLNVFREKAFSVLIGLGYMIGHFIGGRGYYLAYNNSKMNVVTHFLHAQLRESIQSPYLPIYANAYGYIDNQKLAEVMNKNLRPLSITELSQLCQKIDNSLDFSSACVSILEAGTASLFPMACGYAVALESLTKLIPQAESSQPGPPIADKRMAQKLRKAFHHSINEICSSLDDETLSPIRRKIDNINQIPNIDLLQRAFISLGIKLTKSDTQILNTRNVFLHGMAPKLRPTSHGISLEDINNDLFYATMRLYTLINMLVLKYAGFTGWIVNYPKIYEKHHGFKLTGERFFRKI